MSRKAKRYCENAKIAAVHFGFLAYYSIAIAMMVIPMEDDNEKSMKEWVIVDACIHTFFIVFSLLVAWGNGRFKISDIAMCRNIYCVPSTIVALAAFIIRGNNSGIQKQLFLASFFLNIPNIFMFYIGCTAGPYEAHAKCQHEYEERVLEYEEEELEKKKRKQELVANKQNQSEENKSNQSIPETADIIEQPRV
jgi:hypothetical protein